MGVRVGGAVGMPMVYVGGGVLWVGVDVALGLGMTVSVAVAVAVAMVVAVLVVKEIGVFVGVGVAELVTLGAPGALATLGALGALVLLAASLALLTLAALTLCAEFPAGPERGVKPKEFKSIEHTAHQARQRLRPDFRLRLAWAT